MTKICKTCDFCKRLFRRSGYQMKPQEYYLCRESGNFTELKNTCGGWRQKTDFYDLSSARFRQAETDVKTIMEILR